MVIPILEILTGAGTILFWIGFFTIGLAPKNPPEGYFAYEHSFPVPDAILSIALIVSGILLLQGNPLGESLSLVSAGALVFLGVLDCCFNTINGVYRVSTGDLIGNAFINAWCIMFGLVVIWRFIGQAS